LRLLGSFLSKIYKQYAYYYLLFILDISEHSIQILKRNFYLTRLSKNKIENFDIYFNNFSQLYKRSRRINHTLRALRYFSFFFICKSPEKKFKDFDDSKLNKNRSTTERQNSETLYHVVSINYNVESCGAEKRATLIRYIMAITITMRGCIITIGKKCFNETMNNIQFTKGTVRKVINTLVAAFFIFNHINEL